MNRVEHDQLAASSWPSALALADNIAKVGREGLNDQRLVLLAEKLKNDILDEHRRYFVACLQVSPVGHLVPGDIEATHVLALAILKSLPVLGRSAIDLTVTKIASLIGKSPDCLTISSFLRSLLLKSYNSNAGISDEQALFLVDLQFAVGISDLRVRCATFSALKICDSVNLADASKRTKALTAISNYLQESPLNLLDNCPKDLFF